MFFFVKWDSKSRVLHMFQNLGTYKLLFFSTCFFWNGILNLEYCKCFKSCASSKIFRYKSSRRKFENPHVTHTQVLWWSFLVEMNKFEILLKVLQCEFLMWFFIYMIIFMMKAWKLFVNYLFLVAYTHKGCSVLRIHM